MNVANGSTDSDTLRLIAIGTGFTTAGGFVQNSGVVAAESNLSNGLSIIARASTGDIRLYTGSYLEANRRITILSTGNVGIGDTSPLSLFTVGSGDKFRIDNSGNATSSGFLVVGTTAPTPNPLPAGSLFVGASATVTDRIYVGSQLSVATSTPFPGYELTVTGDAALSGNLLVSGGDIGISADTNLMQLAVNQVTINGELISTNGRISVLNATTTNIDTLRLFTELRAPTINATSTVFDHVTSTDRIYVGNQFSVATSTPFPGYEFTVTGNGMVSGNFVVGNVPTLGALVGAGDLYIGADATTTLNLTVL